MVLTSMGKKVMTTITAAFDSQPNPNHMTMIGRDADDRHGADQIAERQQAALQEGHAVDGERRRETQAAADEEAGDHRFQEGLLEIVSQSIGAWRRGPGGRSRLGAGSRMRGTAKPTTITCQR